MCHLIATTTGMSKNNFVACRKHMKDCHFWKMPSLKGKSKRQRDRYFTQKEPCLLGLEHKKAWESDFSQLKWTAITRHQAYKVARSHLCSHSLERNTRASAALLWQTQQKEKTKCLFDVTLKRAQDCYWEENHLRTHTVYTPCPRHLAHLWNTSAKKLLPLPRYNTWLTQRDNVYYFSFNVNWCKTATHHTKTFPYIHPNIHFYRCLLNENEAMCMCVLAYTLSKKLIIFHSLLLSWIWNGLTAFQFIWMGKVDLTYKWHERWACSACQL